MNFKALFLTVVLFSNYIFAQDSSQTLLPLKPTGVEDFLHQNPKFDGRGTLIFVLDTGVDMGIDGLATTSTGMTKVIDVRDFTGEGDVKISQADVKSDNGSSYLKSGDHTLKGIDKVSLKPVDNKYYFGFYSEKRLANSNSNVSDINGNGKSDEYGMAVFKTSSNGETFWVVYFDTNADGTIADEKPVRNYSEKFDIFKITNPDQLPYFTFALNVYPDRKIVSLFFDDGGHGTHVTGIASGYNIGKTDHFNGVAPGAQVIALKIGDNTLSGGATVTESMKRGFLYADSVSKVVKQPCIINLSYGIGSVYEGNSDIEYFLEGLLKTNKYLYACVSNGNDGPGISSAGLPASSRYVFSSGAILTKEVGRDLYGTSLDEDIILHFSSRGGEAAKPDICSPGACVSTVTNYTVLDRFWGTSMASPYSAGVMALLLSAVDQTHPGLKIPSQLLFNAVRESAVKMQGYTHLDQGGGYINVLNAYNTLEKYITSGEVDNFEDYVISSFAPGELNDKAQNLYIRNGLMLGKDDTFKFNVSRVDTREKFYRLYSLESDSDWLIPIQKNLHLRNLQGGVVSVKFDMNKISQPGIYNGKIKAYRSDKSRFPEFDLNATVIMPYRFNADNNYKLSWINEKLMPGRYKRFFLNIPAGTSAISIRMNSVDKNYAEALYMLYNPEGVEIFSSSVLSTTLNANEVTDSHFDLKPGIYELILNGNYMAKGLSTVDLSVELLGVNPVKPVSISETGYTANFINFFNKKRDFYISGRMLGYKKEFTVNFNGTDHYEYPFVVRKNESYKEFTLKMDKDDFNKLTDFSVLILNDSGKAVEKDGFNYPVGGIGLINLSETADSSNYKLVIIPAFANKSSTASVKIEEETFVNTADSITARSSKKIIFYPDIEKKVEFIVQKPSYDYPAGTVPFGRLYFKKDKQEENTELEIPIEYKNKESINE